MTSGEFVDTLSSVLGQYTWKAAFAKGTGYSRTQIYRYSTGHPIPQHVAVMVECLAIIRGNGLPLPSAFDLYPLVHNPSADLDSFKAECRASDARPEDLPQPTKPPDMIIVVKTSNMSVDDVMDQVTTELLTWRLKTR